MDHDRINSFERFLNDFSHQQKLLTESLNQWDSVLESGLEMVKRIEEVCTHCEVKPALLFLKEVLAYGQGMTLLLAMRFSVLKEISQLPQRNGII